MVSKPPLPDDYELHESVGDWIHDPESGRNARVWTGRDDPVSVGVFEFLGDSVSVKVFDDRVSGFCNHVRVYEEEIETGDVEVAARTDAKRPYVREGVEAAIDWMEGTDPGEWSHPDVCEAIFDAPPGYTLDRYYLEERETEVYYLRDGFEKQVQGFASIDPDEYTVETCPYLRIHCWNGSGKAAITLAPWLHAHGLKSQHPEVKAVSDPPEDCGLEVALTVARQWVEETFEVEAVEPAAGQSDLAGWSA